MAGAAKGEGGAQRQRCASRVARGPDSRRAHATTHPVVVGAVLGAPDLLHKVLVVRDDDELKVGLLPAGLDDLVDGEGEALGVGAVGVGRGLVEREDAAVEAEGVGQSEPDDQRGEHLLAGRAAAAHVELRVALAHDHPVGLLAHPSAVCPSSSVLIAMPSMSEPLYVLFHSSVIDLLMSAILVSWNFISAELSAL